MSLISKNTELAYYLNGNPCSAPENIEDTEIIADFSDENVQANITAKNWSFYNEDAQTILDWIAAGKKYQALPFKIEAYNSTDTLVAADLLLDLTTENYLNKWEDERRIVVDIVKDNGLNQFFDGLGAVSLAYLESIGKFTQSDYQDANYLVQKKVNIVEELTTALIGFMMVKELIDQIKEISDTIADGVGHAGGGVTGALAAGVWFAAKIIIQVAYAASILIIIIELGKQMFETFLPPVRTHKTLNLTTAFTNICSHFGYGFNSTISLLDDLYYQPSNPQLEQPKLSDFLTVNPGTTSGIPRVGDAQYSCEAFFDEYKKQFHGKFAIVDGIVEFHPKGSTYWFKQSNYVIPGVRPNQFGDNAADLKASKVFSFAYDLNDEYTIDDQTGRILEVQTTQTGNPYIEHNMIRGSQLTDYRVCLGTRKEGLTYLEQKLASIGGIIDNLVNFFGGNSDLAGSVEARIGMLIQSQNWNSLPKTLLLQGKKIHPNHKALYSTEVLYDLYHVYDSFVENNNSGQHKIVKDENIPFGMVDFITVVNNSYAKDSAGTDAHIDSFRWKLKKDYATADYWTKSVFATNLTETKITPL